jgi:uncharacterized membrane protein
MSHSGKGSTQPSFVQRLRSAFRRPQSSDSPTSTLVPSPEIKDEHAEPEPAALSLEKTTSRRSNTIPQPPPPLGPGPLPSEADEAQSGDDEEEFDYPEGGREAWLVVFGGWCGMVGGFSLMNSVGIIQAYVQENQLKNYTPSTVGWIFSIYLFFIFFGGLQIGPLFDRYGPRYLLIAGSVMMVTMWFTLAECTGSKAHHEHPVSNGY